MTFLTQQREPVLNRFQPWILPIAAEMNEVLASVHSRFTQAQYSGHVTTNERIFMKNFNRISLSILSLSLIAAPFAGAQSNGMKKRHPREAQVVGRANHEEKVNEAAEKSGKISEKQEKSLNRQDERIKKEAKDEMAANGGHLTKGEQKDLNRQENRVNRERRQMERRDARNKKEKPVTSPVGAPPAAPQAQ